MQIILEGVDASGKSTLARALAFGLKRYAYYPSEGPEKYEREILERIKRYETEHRYPAIYDRHPIVSHPIYSRTCLWMTDIPHMMRRDFYSRPDRLLVYCLPTSAGLELHEEVEGIDTDEHLAMIKKEYPRLLADYNEWGLRRAHMIYRCGQDFDATVQRIIKAVS